MCKQPAGNKQQYTLPEVVSPGTAPHSLYACVPLLAVLPQLYVDLDCKDKAEYFTVWAA